MQERIQHRILNRAKCSHSNIITKRRTVLLKSFDTSSREGGLEQWFTQKKSESRVNTQQDQSFRYSPQDGIHNYIAVTSVSRTLSLKVSVISH